MARILNLEAYPLATTISDNSYLIGTDVTDNKETKNFKIEDLKTHILPDALDSGTFVNATVIVDADGQISSVATGSSSGILLTTDFTSGKATLINNVLNIPDYSTGVALVGTYTDGYIPRWSATANTLESGSIRDNGSNIAVGAAVNSERIVNIDNQLATGNDQYGIYINTNTAAGTGGELFGQKIDVNSTGGSNDIYGLEIELQANNGSPDKVKGIVIDQKTNSSASGTISSTIKGIEISVGANTGYTVNGDIKAIDIEEIGKGATISGSTYGVYQEGTSDKNYFGGQLQLNHTAGTEGQFLKAVDAVGNAEWADVPSGVTATSGSNNQVAVFDGTDSIEGDSNFTWNGSTLEVSNGTEYSRVHPDYFYNLSESDDANLYLYTKSNGTSVGSEIIFGRWNGTVGSESPLVNSQLISAQRIMGGYDLANPTNLSTGALIEVRAAENWSTTAQGVRYTIDTNATGETTPTERFAIDSDGNTKITGDVGIGTTPISGKALAVGGNSIISGQLDLNGSGDSKLKLINYLDLTTGEENSNYMTWYKSDNTTRRGYLGFTDENTFRINVQESPDISQIILDADEVILNSTDETQSGTIKSGVWEATPIADAYIAEDYVTATNGAAQRVAVFDGTDSIEGDSNLTWDGSQIDVTDAQGNLAEVRADWVRVYNETDDANLFLYGYGSAHRGEIVLGAANGSRGDEEAINNGNTTATISSWGHNGTSFKNNGQLIFQATEDYTSTVNGTRFILQTVVNGATTPSTRYATDGNGDHTFTGNVLVGGQAYSSIQPTTVAATSSTIDWNDGNVAVLELGGSTTDVTLTLDNPKEGAQYLIKIIQGASLVDVIFPTSVKFAGETAPYKLPVTATDNAIDAVALTCISDSGTVEYLANCSKNYG